MRLTKNSQKNKNNQKKTKKNKILIDEINNIKYKLENPYLQEKIRKYNIYLIKQKINKNNLKDSKKI